MYLWEGGIIDKVAGSNEFVALVLKLNHLGNEGFGVVDEGASHYYSCLFELFCLFGLGVGGASDVE